MERGHPQVWAARARPMVNRLRESARYILIHAKEFNLDAGDLKVVEQAIGDIEFRADMIQGVIDEYHP
jgi:hypothetical protein